MRTDKRGSLVLRNSKIAIVGRVSINSDQINLILFLNLISCFWFLLDVSDHSALYICTWVLVKLKVEQM